MLKPYVRPPPPPPTPLSFWLLSEKHLSKLKEYENSKENIKMWEILHLLWAAIPGIDR